MLNRWLSVALLSAVVVLSRPELQSEMGLRVKRRPSETDEDRHRVTIDLSALRPSLPGLVLYKYGDLAPKLVQVDLAALNPHLQPHVIWPQFSEMEVDERPYDFDAQEAIPYLTEEETLMSPKQHQRLAKMMATSGWMDSAASDNDVYDFVPDANSNQGLSLHGSLPLADEVIVPLDWEQKTKRNVFMTRGWRPGGERERNPAASKSSDTRTYVSRNLGAFSHGFPSKGTPKREMEGDPRTHAQLGKKESPIRHGSRQQPSPRAEAAQQRAEEEAPPVRVSSQESWSVPRQYWTVPHLFVNNWQ